MDTEKRKRVLQIVLESVSYRIGEIKMLFANLEIRIEAGEASRAGLTKAFDTLLKYQQIEIDVKKELLDLENLEGWNYIDSSIGCVYICPKCDRKSPEDFVYCPHCGRVVGRGRRKRGV